MASMVISPPLSAPTPVGNPFEEPDVFAASPPLVSSRPVAAASVVTVASMSASSLPFQVLHQASAPAGTTMAPLPMPLAVATPPTSHQPLFVIPSQIPPATTKATFGDASDFEYVLF